LRESSTRIARPLKVERSLMNALGREPFKTQQRILSSLSTLSEESVAVRANTRGHQEGEWRQLAHPSDRNIDRIAGSVLWWRQAPLSSLDTVHLASDLDDPEDWSIEVRSTPHMTRSPSERVDALVDFNPLKHWVRSPEQAMVRRAILTQREPALLIKASYSSGASTALATAICDWLEHHVGDCVMVTPSVRQVRSLIQSLTSESKRVQLISP
jgi:hypothetical protein